MKIFLTGATGFVGAHTAMALMDAGHSVRLLVRNRQAAEVYFNRMGYEVDDFVIADMREKDKIFPAMAGCDAVIHTAALVSLDTRRAEEIYRNNLDGIDAVIGSAVESGIRNIVYVSSLTALFTPGHTLITEDSPLSNPQEAYSRSKRDCDLHVREMQARGVPVQITYPSGILGPNDPRLAESNSAVRVFFRDLIPLTSSGYQSVDVRDLARVHVYLVENPLTSNFEQGRYITAGHFLTWKELYATVTGLTGKGVTSFRIPGVALRAVGQLLDIVKRLLPFNSPVSAESMVIITQWVPADSGKIEKLVGFRFRPIAETLADTGKWMVEAGHLEARYLGKLAISK